jgi:hypothetical protein
MQCTVNPHSYIKGDVICQCPDSPIDPENDMFPKPPAADSAPTLSLSGGMYDMPVVNPAYLDRCAKHLVLLSASRVVRVSACVYTPANVHRMRATYKHAKVHDEILAFLHERMRNKVKKQ